MVTRESVEEQLKKIGVNYRGWGRSEMSELPSIILPHEEIYECANGIYEGGFALLVATDVRVLLIDKKPMRFLTVEDLRFDMISEIDYSRRILGAQISISTGTKDLRFISLNQPRLRKLIGHVQHCMAENKKVQMEHGEGQKQHLEQINERLQTYLRAQHEQQQKIEEYLGKGERQPVDLDLKPVKPDPRLSDYLYAQGLLAEYQKQGGRISPDELYSEGVKEVFGRQTSAAQPQPQSASQHRGFEINPLSVAYSKLPLAMRNKRFGRPSFHDHSAHNGQPEAAPVPQPVE